MLSSETKTIFRKKKIFLNLILCFRENLIIGNPLALYHRGKNLRVPHHLSGLVEPETEKRTEIEGWHPQIFFLLSTDNFKG